MGSRTVSRALEPPEPSTGLEDLLQSDAAVAGCDLVARAGLRVFPGSGFVPMLGA